MKKYLGVIEGGACDFDFTKFHRNDKFVDFECVLYSGDPTFEVWKINSKATTDFWKYTTELIAPPDNLQWAHPCKFIFSLGMFEDHSLYLDGCCLYGPVRFDIRGTLKRCP